MTDKIYQVFLDDKKIGTSLLEKADASMGVVFGRLNFSDRTSGYELFRTYCMTNKIELVADYPEDKLIITRTIENLVVMNEEGKKIKSLGNQISGMDSDEFEITLEGVPYPFFKEEFPHHVKTYEDQFKEN